MKTTRTDTAHLQCHKAATYDTWEEAQDALLVAQIKRVLRGNRRRRECRSYFCPPHNGFHLTSMAATEYWGC